MREIKFRAKRIDMDRWVYGLYFTTPLTDENSGEPISSGMYFLSYPAKPHHCIVQNDVAFTIDIETLGQYTGLHDKNNKEIYEGDIIQRLKYNKPYSDKKKSCITHSIVVWRDGFLSGKVAELTRNMLEKDPSVYNDDPGFRGKEIYNEKGYGCFNWGSLFSCEIIGNIHENPELIHA
jgi:YopX protein